MSDTTTSTPDTAMTPEPRKPLRKRTWFRVTGGLIAVAVIGGIAAGAAGSHAKPAVVTSPSASSAPAQPATPPASTPPATPATPPPAPTTNLAAGQSINVSDPEMGYKGTITVDWIKVTQSSENGDMGEAPANGNYVIAHVTYKAAAGSQLDANSFDWYALVHGTHYDTDNGNAISAVPDSEQLQSTTLNGGETTSGTIEFDLASAHGQIVYSPNSDGSSLATWNY